MAVRRIPTKEGRMKAVPSSAFASKAKQYSIAASIALLFTVIRAVLIAQTNRALPGLVGAPLFIVWFGGFIFIAWWGYGPSLVYLTISAVGTFATSTRRAYSIEGLVLYIAFGVVCICIFELRRKEHRKAVKRAESSQRELHRRIQELAEVDRQKNEFLAMLSHELRNPLSPILNCVKMLSTFAGRSDEQQQVEKRQEMHAMIQRQVKHMSKMLDDLLDIGRLNQGKIKLRKEPVDLVRSAKNVLAAQHSNILARNHTLESEFSAQQVTINGDPDRIEQIITNLLANAIKYTNDGGTIRMTVGQAADGWASLTIKDNGVGINPDAFKRLFKIFSQASHSIDRSQGGLGIGLALSQELARLHGGLVQAHSDGLGKGSTFTLRLPASKNDGLLHQHPASAHKLEKAHESLRILIADDNYDAADSLSMLMAEPGHDCIVVYDGATALEKVNSYNPDVVLLDIGLPRLDGYTVCKMIRDAGFGGLVVAITGYGSSEDRRRSREVGFDYHLTKPVDSQEIEMIVNHYIGQLKSREESNASDSGAAQGISAGIS
jgi:signal transduction histidine kinase/CheY-like chemotaxis protein